MLNTSPQPRTIAFIDIENLVGSADPNEHECVAVRQVVEAHLDVQRSPVVAACSHHAARVAAFAWPSARWKWRSGENGADTALIDDMDLELIADRFDRVLIGSGDGIFAEVAALLAVRGVQVDVVSRHGSLSNRLRLAAGATFEFGLDTVDTDGVAVA